MGLMTACDKAPDASSANGSASAKAPVAETSEVGGPEAPSSFELVGKPAPPVKLPLVGGGTLDLAALRGKVVILDFWATWCAPCLVAMPSVNAVAQEFQGNGVEVYFINVGQEEPVIRAELEKRELKLRVAMDIDGAVGEAYRAAALPQTVIVDADGVVATMHLGFRPGFEEQLRTEIRSILANRGSAPALK